MVAVACHATFAQLNQLLHIIVSTIGLRTHLFQAEWQER